MATGFTVAVPDATAKGNSCTCLIPLVQLNVRASSVCAHPALQHGSRRGWAAAPSGEAVAVLFLALPCAWLTAEAEVDRAIWLRHGFEPAFVVSSNSKTDGLGITERGG